MEILFFIIFGGLLLFFIGYGFKLYREDKRIFKELDTKERLDRLSMTEEEARVQYSEWPYVVKDQYYS
jgi:hypothetical protein